MALTPILSLPQVAPNQNQKETTINSALAILEAASNDEDSFSLVGGNLTLSSTDFTRAFHLQFTGQTVARDVTFPGTPRFVAVSNDGTYNITLKTAGAGSTVTVEPGKRVLVISDGVNVVSVSAGVSLFSSLSDVSGAADAADGQLLRFDSGTETWGPVDNFVEHSAWTDGEPTASKVIYRHVVSRSQRLFSDFSGSQAYAGVDPVAGAQFLVKKNGTLVGTFTFATAANTATFSTDVGSGSTSISLAPGDRLTIEAPASPDLDLADVSVTLKGVYL